MIASVLLTTAAAHAGTVWEYNFNSFTLSSPLDGTHDWEDQQSAVGLWTANPNEGWTVQGSSNTGRSRGNIILNPYGTGNILESVWPQTTTGGHLKAWHGYATGGSGNIVGSIQPFITDMATADRIHYTFDVKTPNSDASGSGNHTQWTLGAFSAPGNAFADVLFKLGYYDPNTSSAAGVGATWKLYTGSTGATVTNATKLWAFQEHLTVDVDIDLTANTLSVLFNGVADTALTGLSLGAATPRTADEIYFDSHGGQVVSLKAETISNPAPEPSAFLALGTALPVLLLRRKRPSA